MNFSEQVHRGAQRAEDFELYEALATLKEHIKYREEIKESAAQGRITNRRPPWASPGKKRRRGHLSF